MIVVDTSSFVPSLIIRHIKCVIFILYIYIYCFQIVNNARVYTLEPKSLLTSVMISLQLTLSHLDILVNGK